jgi:hypothetical protein
MGRGLTVLLAIHMQRATRQVHLVPAERHQFAHAKPVPEREEDQRRVAGSVPSDLGGRGDQPLDFGRCEVLAGCGVVGW